jgi:hypothetical protein
MSPKRLPASPAWPHLVNAEAFDRRRCVRRRAGEKLPYPRRQIESGHGAGQVELDHGSDFGGGGSGCDGCSGGGAPEARSRPVMPKNNFAQLFLAR